MLKKISFVSFFGIVIAAVGVIILKYRFPIGPVVFGLGLFTLAGLTLTGRSLKSAIPDIIFGMLDTGLLTIPALWGGCLFGVAGAIAGSVIGDALTDGIAGFVEGSISTWLRSKGIDESREPVTTAMGKMAGCLLGAGFVLTIALIIGVVPEYA